MIGNMSSKTGKMLFHHRMVDITSMPKLNKINLVFIVQI